MVEFALSLPSEFFLSGGFRRRPFRDAMQDVLPDKVRRRHQKFQPFPGRYADMAEARDALVARMTALQADEKARAVLDFEKLGELIAAIPSPETIRREMADGDNPQEEEIMTAAERLLQLAAYIRQHGAETHDET